MARSRLLHQLGLVVDRDVAHAATVAALACVASGGLLYLGYLAHVLRVARRAPCTPIAGGSVLLFGKHAPRGRPDADFNARLARAAALWQARPPPRMLLLGGGPAGGPSEAALAHGALLSLGVPADAPLLLEDRSRDTLQNLRNARELLRREPHDDATPDTVTLLSSRYHLARCALFARNLGLRWEVCAAEPAFSWGPSALWRVAGEAAYVCWVDVGTRWARLIGHRRMLARIT